MAFRQSIRLSKVTGGVFWAVIASLATAATHAAMRGVDLHPFLIAFWRNLICLAIIVDPKSHREAILLVSLGSARRWRSRQERTPSYMLVEQAAANVVGFRRLIAAAVPSPPHFVDHSGDRWAAVHRQTRLCCFRGLNCTFGFLGVRSCCLRQRPS